ncbi:hypothetical protein LEP1GSC021_2821 [Leptospira noguchii str. 1993005606]|nr:hypothetical protein LEP1GSC021_2821 [Leptospira noguchii str. 1993005606]
MAHDPQRDLSSDPRSETLSSGKRCAEFFSLQFLRNFHYNRFRICYAELTLIYIMNFYLILSKKIYNLIY